MTLGIHAYRLPGKRGTVSLGWLAGSLEVATRASRAGDVMVPPHSAECSDGTHTLRARRITMAHKRVTFTCTIPCRLFFSGPFLPVAISFFGGI